jgi:hypothetical protein
MKQFQRLALTNRFIATPNGFPKRLVMIDALTGQWWRWPFVSRFQDSDLSKRGIAPL